MPPEVLYSSYWYRSGTNNTMRTHLRQLAEEAAALLAKPAATVLDIGCNDGTLLNNYPRSFARFGVDRGKLTTLVEGAACLGSALEFPVRKLDGMQRRLLEVAAISALPFDCYFVDRVHQLEPKLVWKLLHAARLRGAGVIFSTDRLALARRFANVGAFVSNGQLHWAENLQETVESHGQAG